MRLLARSFAPPCPQARKQQDNLSKEMKQRLRQEYYGLGGAENKVSCCCCARGRGVAAAQAHARP